MFVFGAINKVTAWASDGPKDMNQSGWSSKSASYVAKRATLE